jgi:hypothetical protein
MVLLKQEYYKTIHATDVFVTCPCATENNSRIGNSKKNTPFNEKEKPTFD